MGGGGEKLKSLAVRREADGSSFSPSSPYSWIRGGEASDLLLQIPTFLGRSEIPKLFWESRRTENGSKLISIFDAASFSPGRPS